MAWPWTELNAQIGRALDDIDGTEYNEALRLDATNAALRQMVARIAPQMVASTTASSLVMPDDLYQIKAVRITDNVQGIVDFIPRIDLTLDRTIGLQVNVSTFSLPDAYWVWDKTIYFGRLHDKYDVYYLAYWPTVSADTENVDVPVWAREPLICLTIAYCLSPALLLRGRLGAWLERSDQDPIKNSLIQAAEYYRTLYEKLMQEHQQRIR